MNYYYIKHKKWKKYSKVYIISWKQIILILSFYQLCSNFWNSFSFCVYVI